MITKIEIEKSKETGQIIFERSWSDKATRWFIFLLFTLLPPVLAIIYLPELKDDLYGQFVLVGATFCWSALLIFNATSKKSLKMMRVPNHLFKKEHIIQAILELNWWIAADEQSYLVIIPKVWDRKQITIIYDVNDFLISSVRFGRGSLFAFSEETCLKVFFSKIGYTPPNQQLKLTV
jgi:hypothetical protein